MTLLELILFLLIAGICGFLAEMVVGFSPGGFLASIAIGLVGAYLGSWLAGLLGLPAVLSTETFIPETGGANLIGGDFNFDIMYSILGAIVLLFIISAVRRPRRRRVYRP
jgi:uncharacterized membrane protein YeaQ/YmgE (transglycosylase-associated protein family)